MTPIDYQGTPSKILQLLDLLAAGCTKSTIVEQLELSPTSVDRYLRSLREDWGCEVVYDRGLRCYRLVSSGVFARPG